jgi:hypothetical protein
MACSMIKSLKQKPTEYLYFGFFKSKVMGSSSLVSVFSFNLKETEFHAMVRRYTQEGF